MPSSDADDRRNFLKKTGAAVTSMVAIAGCAGNNNGSSNNSRNTASKSSSGGNSNNSNPSSGGNSGRSSNAKANWFQLTSPSITTLDPVENTGVSSGIVIQQMFDALMSYPNGKIAVKKQLAKKVETSSDYTKYTFTLRKGVKFHNGKELTAKDFIYAWERLAASKNSRRSYFILDSLGVKHETDSDGNYKPGSLAITAKDKYTLQVKLKQPFHAALEMFAYSAFAAVPKGLVKDVPGYEGKIKQSEFSKKKPIGCGPFQFVQWKSSNNAEVKRFANYYGDKAKANGIHWEIIEDQNARYTYIMNKNADLFELSIPKYKQEKAKPDHTDKLGREFGKYGPIRNGKTINYVSVSTITSGAFNFNMQRVPKAVRQACAYMLNQQESAKALFKGRAKPAYHWTPPNIYPGGTDAYTKHAKNHYPYGYNETQQQKAKKVMENAGYGPNNRFSMSIETFNDLPEFKDAANLLRDKMSSVYVDIKVSPAPPSALINKARKGNLDGWSYWWIMDWPAPDNFLQLLNPPQTDINSDTPAISYINWTTGTNAQKQATKAYQKVLNNPKPTDTAKKARNKAYIKIEEANWKDVGFLPLYHPLSQRYWYDWCDFKGFGAAGPSRMNFNHVSIGKRK